MFTPGKSGNPGGRPKIAPEVKALALKSSSKALRRVIALMETSEDERIQLEAAKVVMDRGWGKVPQAITGADGNDLVVKIVQFAGTP